MGDVCAVLSFMSTSFTVMDVNQLYVQLRPINMQARVIGIQVDVRYEETGIQ